MGFAIGRLVRISHSSFCGSRLFVVWQGRYCYDGSIRAREAAHGVRVRPEAVCDDSL